VIIAKFRDNCDKILRKKMLTMGLTPGTEIEIIRIAPLGDPIEVKLRGYFLSLRKAEFDCLDFFENSCHSCTKSTCKIC
jgi:Fe2+ transport system protein FeoA